MKALASPPRRSEEGFTLIEAAVGLTLFSVLGYALLLAVDTSNRSRRSVMEQAKEHRTLRAATHMLVDELSCSSDEEITLTTPQGGNHTVRFQLPIDGGGADDFGVGYHGVAHDDWSLVYAVEDLDGPGDDVQRQLVRRVVDENDQTRSTEIVAARVRGGGEDPPGFTMVKQGEMWVLTLSTDGEGQQPGIREVFHVRTRN